MPKRFVITAIALLALLTFSPVLRAQTAPAKNAETKGMPPWNDAPPGKAAYAGTVKRPPPRRDLSGIWNGQAEGGVQNDGALEHPAVAAGQPAKERGGQADEKNIARPIPYTPAGLAALQANKPTAGVRAVGPDRQNNPVDICDPVGFPQLDLLRLKVVEFAQAENQVLALYQFSDTWRVIWTDGRALPDAKSAEPRWNGYSVGRWVDDYTFVVQTMGVDDRTWLDNAGRPHTTNMRVEERYHLADYDTLELTVTIDDPEYYRQRWQALNKFVLHRLPDNFDIEESVCSPSGIANYNKLLENVLSTPEK
jgi:hypothetical protein